MKKSLNKTLEESFRKNWDREALSDYKGKTMKYSDVAQHIAAFHMLFEQCGLQKGDKIAICSKNQSNWVVAFLATITYGAVAVPILHEFKPGNIHHLVNHSDAKAFFVGSNLWDNLSDQDMPNLQAIIRIDDLKLVFSRQENITTLFENFRSAFAVKYPGEFSKNSFSYHEDAPDELALISYTSGTSGFSKGVMIPYRSLFSNVRFAREYAEPQMNEKSKVVSMLPSSHMYGMMFEFLFEMTIGAHVYFLTRLPSPKVILQACAEIHPDIIIAVPLIIEKVYKNKLLPMINRKGLKLLLNLPVIDSMIEKRIQQELVQAFGGNFKEVIIGGAALNREAEAFFKKIEFPYTVGYGMTECGPIIAYDACETNKLYSCGKAAPRMEIMIDSPDPANVPGEVLVKGDNVFLGYYKNPEATAAAFTKKGWFRTGDMGVVDKQGYLFLRGRCKSMILGPSGQNIYPEELEGSINNLPYVGESLVIDDGGQLVALIYPDMALKEAENLNDERLKELLDEQVQMLNIEFPNYCKIAKVEIFPEEFEKTPKHSIKRYLYQR